LILYKETLKPQPLEGLKIQIVKENSEFETGPGVLSIPYNIVKSIESKIFIKIRTNDLFIC